MESLVEVLQLILDIGICFLSRASMAWGTFRHPEALLYLLPVLWAGRTSNNLFTVVPDDGITDFVAEAVYG